MCEVWVQRFSERFRYRVWIKGNSKCCLLVVNVSYNMKCQYCSYNLGPTSPHPESWPCAHFGPREAQVAGGWGWQCCLC